MDLSVRWGQSSSYRDGSYLRAGGVHRWFVDRAVMLYVELMCGIVFVHNAKCEEFVLMVNYALFLDQGVV